MKDETQLLTRSAAEEFLFLEARLIDEWKLEEWAALFTPEGEYFIPSLEQPNAEPHSSLFFVYDDRHRLTERAIRLLKPQAHAEFPKSKVRHIVSNVSVEGVRDGCIRVASNFVVYRSRRGETQMFPGHALHDLVVSEERIAIRRKRVMVDTDSLREQGRISIIL